MAVQILGLRDYTDSKGSVRKSEKFFNKGWRAASVPYLFANCEEIIQDVPEAERYNLYYTASNCLEEAGRKLESQWIIPFDIDGLEVDRYKEYIPIILDVLGVDEDKTGIVMSGNGLQLIIGIKTPITDVEYFEENRMFYKAVCGDINQQLFLNGLAGDADVSVWSPARLLRLPYTQNRKKNKSTKQAFMVQPNIELVDFDLRRAAKLPEVEPEDQMSANMLRRLPPPDTKGVLSGCEFLRYAKLNQESITEPQWYGMLSIVGRLENNTALAHEFSSSCSTYEPAATERKMMQAVESSGPRTCRNICSMWDGCRECPHWGKINSPITLRSASYIATRDTGFHKITTDANGQPKKGKADYDDLMLYYTEEHPFITLEGAKIVYAHDKQKWVDQSMQRIYSFAEKNFDPKPNNQMCNEFHGKLTRNNIRDIEFFDVEHMINFNNGVLSLEDMTLTEHTPEIGFKYVLPFDYDPTATCPRFDKFLKEVTCSDTTLQTVLLEYMGYALSGMDAAIGQKALILEGEGANGKSVWLDVIKHLAGKGNYSTLSMGTEINKLENRYQLDGKLFNISEETPVKSMMDNSIFKALVTGGEVQARKLYHDAYSMRNTAKIIMACNELPPTEDLTHGMFRRLLIIPFGATFTEETADKDIRQKLYAEASGIYNRVLEALTRFRSTKEFSSSQAIKAKLDAYRRDNNVMMTWFQETYKENEGSELEIDRLYGDYVGQMDMWRVKPLARQAFVRDLKRVIGDDKFVRSTIDGRRVRVVKGYSIETGGEF